MIAFDEAYRKLHAPDDRRMVVIHDGCVAFQTAEVIRYDYTKNHCVTIAADSRRNVSYHAAVRAENWSLEQ